MLHPTQTPCNVLLTIQTHRSVTSYKKHIQLIASYNKSVINFRKQSSFTTLAKMARVVSEMTVLYVADMDTRRSKYQLNITLAFRDLTQLDNRLGIWPVKNLASASPNGSSWAIYDRPGQTCVSQRALRSVTNNDMVVPCSRLKFGERAFSIAAPRAWNSIPAVLRITLNTATFKKNLKTFLFRESYSSF